MGREIDQAIKLARQMRLLLIRVIGKEKDQAQQDDDYEYSDEKMDDFFKESSDDVPAVDLLSKIDQLIYDLMDYQGGGDGWIDAKDFDSKEMLKLKEVIHKGGLKVA